MDGDLIRNLEDFDAAVALGKIPVDEYFDEIFGATIGWDGIRNKPIKKIIGYRGRKSGIRVGTWFAEVMEP